jgi:hypothetical protein
MPHALSPALLSGNKRVRIDGVIFVLVAPMIFLVGKRWIPIAISSSSRRSAKAFNSLSYSAVSRSQIDQSRFGDEQTGLFPPSRLGMTILASLVGSAASIRQILQHIVPAGPGCDQSLLQLHIYPRALVVFAA